MSEEKKTNRRKRVCLDRWSFPPGQRYYARHWNQSRREDNVTFKVCRRCQHVSSLRIEDPSR